MVFKNLLLLACFALSAAGMDLGGPLSGLLYDPHARAIRAIQGVPGGSSLGPVVAGGLDSASIAPSGRLALVVKDHRLVLLRDLLGSGQSESEVAWEGLPDLISWNGDSTAAALYSLGSGIRLLTIESESEWLGEPLPVPEHLGRVVALALSPAGHILVATQSPEWGGLYLTSTEESPRLLLNLEQPSALAFRNRGLDLIVADSATTQVFEIRAFAGSAVIVPFPVPAAENSRLVGVAGSSDGNSVFLADEGTNTLTVVNAANGFSSTISLDFTPSGLEPVAAGPLFLLKSGGGNEPFFVLDDRLGTRVYFVPAAGPAAMED